MPTRTERIAKYRTYSSSLRAYVIRIGDIGYHLVGPFEDEADAEEWASSPENNPNDDRRWHVVWLDAPEIASEFEPYVFDPGIVADMAHAEAWAHVQGYGSK
jgi:hypothetical protein